MLVPSRTALIVSAIVTAIVLNVVVQALGIEPAIVLGNALSGAIALGAWYVIQQITKE